MSRLPSRTAAKCDLALTLEIRAGYQVVPQPRGTNRQDGGPQGSRRKHGNALWGPRRKRKNGCDLLPAGPQGEYADTGREGRAEAEGSYQAFPQSATETVISAPPVILKLVTRVCHEAPLRAETLKVDCSPGLQTSESEVSTSESEVSTMSSGFSHGWGNVNISVH